MSVVNKMLQDLEKRQQGHGIHNISTPQVQYVAPNKATSIFVYCAISIGVGICLLLGWQHIVAPAEKVAQARSSEVIASQTQIAVMPDSAATDAVQARDESEVKIESEAQGNTDVLVGNKDPDVNPDNDPESIKTDGLVERTALVAKDAVKKEPNNLTASDLEISAAKPDAVKASTSDDNRMSLSTLGSARASESDHQSAKPNSNSQNEHFAMTEVVLSNPQLAQKHIAQAAEFERSGQLEQAVSAYVQALQLDSSQHQARKQLAALYYGQGRLLAAADVLEQGIILYPKVADFSLLLARVQQVAGQDEAALATLAGISDTGDLGREKWVQQSEIAQKLGRFDLAETAYRNLTRQEPSQAKWWMGLGFSLDSQTQYRQAISAYKTALTLQGLSTNAAAYISHRLEQLGTSHVGEGQ